MHKALTFRDILSEELARLSEVNHCRTKAPGHPCGPGESGSKPGSKSGDKYIDVGSKDIKQPASRVNRPGYRPGGPGSPDMDSAWNGSGQGRPGMAKPIAKRSAKADEYIDIGNKDIRKPAPRNVRPGYKPGGPGSPDMDPSFARKSTFTGDKGFARSHSFSGDKAIAKRSDKVDEWVDVGAGRQVRKSSLAPKNAEKPSFARQMFPKPKQSMRQFAREMFPKPKQSAKEFLGEMFGKRRKK